MHTLVTDLLIKSTVVLAAGCAASLALGRAPAAMRHLLWTMVALALLLVPALEMVMPAWHVRALPQGPLFRFATDATADGNSAPATAAGRLETGRRAASSGPAQQPARRIDWVLLIWAAGVAVSLARLAAAVAMCGVLRRDAEHCGEVEGVRLLRSPRAIMPITFGVWRPAILLPRDADRWPAAQREIVISHELAHVRRRDCLVQILARVAFGLYWFHPLAWWASRQMVRERELASDDLVLAAGVRASDYAAVLLDVARSFQPAGVVAAAGVAMARKSELEGRMLAILDSNLRRGVVSRAGALTAGACVMALVLPLAAMRPAPQSAEGTVAFRAELLQSTDLPNIETAAKAQADAKQSEPAVKLYERALELRERMYGSQSPEFATGLINLAEAYRHSRVNGNWEKSIALYKRALPIQEAALGSDHPDVATTLYHLAHNTAGNPGNAAAPRTHVALEMYQRALDIRTKAFGPSDARVAEILVAMAPFRNDEIAYQRALASADAAAPSSSLTATALEIYAHWLAGHDRGAEAEPMTARAKQIRTDRVREIGTLRGPSPGAISSVYKVGGGVTPPKLAYKFEPEYSEEARAEKVAGAVLLYIEVGTDGYAHNVKLVRGVGSGLDEKAAEAIGQWKFTPGTKDGQAVTVAATVEVNFKLL